MKRDTTRTKTQLIEEITKLRVRISELEKATIDLKQMEENEHRYRMAQTIGHVGNWEYNLQNAQFWGSDEAKRIYGFEPGQLNFSTEEVEKCIPERERVHQALIDLIELGKPYNLEFEILPLNSTTPRVIASVAELQKDQFGKPIKVVGVIQDITDRKRAEEELYHLNRELHAISNCNQTLLRAVDEQTLLNNICRIICEEAGYRSVWVGYIEHDTAKTVKPIAWAGFDRDYITNVKVSWSEDTESGRGLTGKAIRTGKMVYTQDIPTDPDMASWRVSALQQGYRSGIALPLKDETDNVFGVLLIFSSKSYAITPDEIRLLEELADDLAFGIITLRTRAQLKRNEAINAIRLHLIQFSVSHSLDELLEETLNETEKLTGSLIGFYHFVNEDQKSLMLQNWSTRTKSEFCKAEGKGAHYAIAEAGVWVDCIYQRKPVIHNDYPSLSHRKGMPEGHAAVIRELVVPVFRGDKITAILGVGNKPTEYTQQDIEIVSLLADLAWEIAERKRTEEALRESEVRYRALFEGAAEGILVADIETKIFIYANPAQCRMLGYTKDEIRQMNVSDIHPKKDLARILDEFMAQARGDKLVVENIPCLRKDGSTLYADIRTTSMVIDGIKCNVGFFNDITERKRAEERQQLSIGILQILNQAENRSRTIEDILKYLQSILHYDAVGIRLKEGEDYPYFVQNGFLENFLKEENFICAKDGTGKVIHDTEGKVTLECTCGLVISGRTDPTMSCFTKNGSFWTNKSSDLLALEPNADPRTNPRNRCIHTGYESIALIPLRVKNEIIGLLQLNDRKPNRFSLELIRFFEGIAPSIGIAISRHEAEEALQQREQFLNSIVENIPNMIFVKDAEDLRFVRFNKAGEELLGYTRQDLLGKNDYDFFSKPEADFFTKKDHEVLRNKKLVDIPEENIQTKVHGERILHTKKIPILDKHGIPQYLLGISDDITDHKRAEDRILMLNSLLQAIRKVNEILVRVKEEAQLYQQICDTLTKVSYIKFVWIGLLEPKNYAIKPIAYAGIEDGYLSSIKITWDDSEYSKGPSGTAIKTKHPSVVNDIATDSSFGLWREEALKHGYVSTIALPLIYEQEVIGILRAYSGIKDIFGEEEVEFLTEVAQDIAVGIKSLKLEKKLEQTSTHLRQALDETIKTIAKISELRDPYTAGHQLRVAQLATAIAIEFELPERTIEGIRITSSLHDLGKLIIPSEILSKPTKLTKIEFELIKTHSETGYEMLSGLAFPWPVADIILQHHERLNGSGYPRGLKGAALLLEAKILAVADVVEAMSSHRPYRPALGIAPALDEIKKNSGILYDSKVVDTCLELFQKKGFQFTA
ncbi:MAG: GAF domain-containing protein [bacterium]